MQLWMTAFRPDLNSRGLPHILMPQGLKWIEIRACRFPLHKRTKWGLLIGKFEHIPQNGYRAGFKLRVPLVCAHVCVCVCVCTFPDKNKTLVKPKELAVWRDSSYRPTGSIQRHWGFKLRGATTVTLVWASVSFFLKFPCTNTHTQTHSALSTLPLLVCVCVCEITQLATRWFSTGRSVTLAGSRARSFSSRKERGRKKKTCSDYFLC